MKILDATLRDGGFVNDFNWDMEFARKHLADLVCLNLRSTILN